MANEEYLKLLKSGIQVWNQWRDEHGEIVPDLKGAKLSRAGLHGADLSGAGLRLADLEYADLRGVDLSGADLRAAKLCGADLRAADLRSANLRGAKLSAALLGAANLRSADLRGADLQSADFFRTSLIESNFTATKLSGANFQEALIGNTVFADVDLREVKGLERVRHYYPSEVSVTTLYRSEGQISEVFLRDCGVPESFIVQVPSLVAAMQPIQFYSCFISYSGKDEEFARRLHSRLREAQLRVWFAPEDMKGGDKLYAQIDRAIQVHERLLLVLSKSSLRSKWVETEIRRARRVELREGRRKLFPIRLVGYEALQEWECIDSTSGEDLAEEVRSYFIPDFSNWKNHDDLEQAFARLLADLKASA